MRRHRATALMTVTLEVVNDKEKIAANEDEFAQFEGQKTRVEIVE